MPVIHSYHCADRGHWSDLLQEIRAEGDTAFGVELEVVGRDESITYPDERAEAVAQAAYPAASGIICEYDGSLPDGGVEIIGPPQPLSVAGTVHDAWTTIIPDIHAAGARGWHQSSCGMHVSIDTFHMTREQIARIILAANRWHHVPSVAGRDCSQYARRDLEMSRERAEEYAGYGNEKYSAAYKNGDRLELRIFRSNVTVAGYQRVMRWVSDLVAFATDTPWKRFDEKTFLAYEPPPGEEEREEARKAEIRAEIEAMEAKHAWISDLYDMLYTVQRECSCILDNHRDRYRDVQANARATAENFVNTGAIEYLDRLRELHSERCEIPNLRDMRARYDRVYRAYSDAHARRHNVANDLQRLRGTLTNPDHDRELLITLACETYDIPTNETEENDVCA